MFQMRPRAPLTAAWNISMFRHAPEGGVFEGSRALRNAGMFRTAPEGASVQVLTLSS